MNMNYIDTIAWMIHDMGSDSDPSEKDWPLYRIYAVLCLAKGTETTAEDVHDAWSAWQSGIFPEHRSLIPFNELSEQVQRYDDEYVRAIHKVAIHLQGDA